VSKKYVAYADGVSESEYISGLVGYFDSVCHNIAIEPKNPNDAAEITTAMFEESTKSLAEPFSKAVKELYV